jgi:hypothetical protein
VAGDKIVCPTKLDGEPKFAAARLKRAPQKN